ncbi:MAG: hypothetical protein GYB66_02180 [Chloroflexi bacterium]|nr:hypothetical protein [Chloroflexota bacterium]
MQPDQQPAPDVQEIKLNPTGSPVRLHHTPHGVIRTLLHRGAESTESVQFTAQYDQQRLIFVLVIGPDHALLTTHVLAWLWENFPDDRVDEAAFQRRVHAYLQGDAREIKGDGGTHSIVLGAVSRQLDTGRLWLAWLGTAGVRGLNPNREPLLIPEALEPGEGWSSQDGVLPGGEVQPHVAVFPINSVDRLLVFSSVLRPLIDEIPFIGRAALQRVAEAYSNSIPTLLFDLHPYQVVAVPGELDVRYRWESPYEATLLWSGSANATGYRVEQATTPSFDDATVIAELTDARQRLYRVQPPTRGEVYYRVVPLTENVAGVPSAPVVVTPVPLVSPIMGRITWLDNGGMHIEWVTISQADRYELESSPDPDFDSPETGIIYQGEATFYDTEPDFPPGWYFRVRSVNTHFAPKSPSLWSRPVQAPLHLATPAFEHVSNQFVTWQGSPGASGYEIRQLVGRDAEGEPQYKSVGTVSEPVFELPETRMAVYQVRAIHASGNEDIASPWTQSVFVNHADAPDVAKTVEVPILEDVKTAKVALDDTLPQTRQIQQERSGRGWQMGLGFVVGALLLGLLAGVIGGPRLGIGMDATATPLPAADRDATATQRIEFIANATQAAVAQALGTENANTLTSEISRSGTREAVDAQQIAVLQDEQEVSRTQVAELELTLDAGAGELESQRAALETAQARGTENAVSMTREANAQATLTGNLNNQYATATADAQQIADLEDELETQEATQDAVNTQLAQARGTSTRSATVIAIQQTTATANAQLLEDLDDARATDSVAQDQLVATVTAQSDAINHLEQTLTAIPPTATPTPTPEANIEVFGFAPSMTPGDQSALHTCDWQGIVGTLTLIGGEAGNGFMVRVTGGDLPAPIWVASGTRAEYGAGGWGIQLGVRPHAERYRLQVFSPDRRTALSASIEIVFDGECPGNEIHVDIVQVDPF